MSVTLEADAVPLGLEGHRGRREGREREGGGGGGGGGREREREREKERECKACKTCAHYISEKKIPEEKTSSFQSKLKSNKTTCVLFKTSYIYNKS